MIDISDKISIREDELKFNFMRSGGPGGQNVNRVETAVQLRFDVKNSPSLPEDVRERLYRISGKRLTDEGVLIITANRYRTQESNRKDAIKRLVNLIERASEKPKIRRPTKPSQQSKRRRLEEKRERARKKELRKEVIPPDE